MPVVRKQPRTSRTVAGRTQSPAPVASTSIAEKRLQAVQAANGAWAYTRRGYALSQSVRQLTRRKFASLATLLVFGITLALPALILITAGSLSALGASQVQEESITVYLDPSVADLDGASLAQQLLAREGVARTRYVSRDEALAVFRSQSDIGDALAALGENPLPGAIVVYPETQMLDKTRINRLADSLGKLPGVERVQFDLKWVQRLQAILSFVRTTGWLLAGFLTLTALLVIGNTIRLELLRRQSELEVARLLGARNSFLNRPLLYTGALYGFLGGIVACLFAVAALDWVRGPANEISSLYASAFRLPMPSASQLATVVMIATLLGLIGAAATVYRPARHMLPIRRTGI